MKLRRTILPFAAALGLFGLPLGSPTLAEDKPTTPAKPATAPAQMPSQEEMMKAWMAAATPGEAHKKLEPFAGSFTVKTKMWMDPSKPPEETAGTSENKWVLGGRFIEQRVEGTAMGQPFSGIGYTGYDNYKKHFVGTWMDSMGTMVMVSTGHADAGGKVFTFTGKMDDVVAGKTVSVREVTRVIDNDHNVFEMYGPDKTGKEFKTMEIAYTRK